MKQKRLLFLLALLLTAATGAWADGVTMKEITSASQLTSTDDEAYVAACMPSDFLAVDADVAEAWTGAPVGPVILIYAIDGDKIKMATFFNGSYKVTTGATWSIESFKNQLTNGKFFYTAASSGYTVSLKDGVKDADKWTVKVGDGQAQALPISGLKGDGSETVTLQYTGRLKVKGVKATSEAAPAAGKTVDLSTLTADYEAQNGDVLTGVTSSYKVTIAAGATVTLDGVDISGNGGCIRCLGDATIILKDGSTNTLYSSSQDYPALSIGDANTTLTIQGSTGVLNVSSGMFCAGIGGGYANTNSTCGNIRIEGGVITAKGGSSGAGIGSDYGGICGDIIITGGTITAKGGDEAAGIGTGNGDGEQAVCGNITIANTVTKVTATAGGNAPQSIGKGNGSNATCGTITIGGTKYWENNAAVNGGDTYLAKSPLTVDPSAPAGSGSDIPNSDPYTPGGDPFSF